MKTIYMKLHEKPYDLIHSGTKTVEVRLYDEKRRGVAPGDTIIFQKMPYLHEMQYKTVSRVVRFGTFAELFAAYPKSALGCGDDDTADDFTHAMGKYYTDEKAAGLGVCAIELLPYAGGFDIHPTHARRINDRDIEIYFDGDFETGAEPQIDRYAVALDGSSLAFDENYGRNGHVHFCRMTTLRLKEPLGTGEDAPTVTVTLDGCELPAPYENYYKYEHMTKCGIPVRGSAALIWGQKTVERAGEIVDIMLSVRSDIAEQMVRSGASLAVFGRGECAFHIPEHRGSYNTRSLYVDGFGGITCSITESNVWHWHRQNDERPDKSYATNYKNECILVHEFGHGVKIAGFDRMADRSLATEFRMIYRHAKAAGLWPNTYAISNSDEYFATLSAIWFNVMNECARDDGWDGVRGPINTRRELYNYDIDAYRFFSKIYPYRDLDGAWTPVPDTVHLTGLPDEPDRDLSSEDHTFVYPERKFSPPEICFDEVYKIELPRGGLVMDTGASNGFTGIWHDYSGDTDDVGAMTFTFERAGERDSESEGMVYIKGARDGYLHVDFSGDAPRVYASDEGEPDIFGIEFDERGLARIFCCDSYLAVDGKPSVGVPLTLVSDADGDGADAEDDEKAARPPRRGYWRLTKMSDAKLHILFLHGGRANGDHRGVYAAAGDKITLTSPVTVDGCKPFSHWRVSAGEIDDAGAETAVFTMPDSDAVVWAE